MGENTGSDQDKENNGERQPNGGAGSERTKSAKPSTIGQIDGAISSYGKNVNVFEDEKATKQKAYDDLEEDVDTLDEVVTGMVDQIVKDYDQWIDSLKSKVKALEDELVLAQAKYEEATENASVADNKFQDFLNLEMTIKDRFENLTEQEKTIKKESVPAVKYFYLGDMGIALNGVGIIDKGSFKSGIYEAWKVKKQKEDAQDTTEDAVNTITCELSQAESDLKSAKDNRDSQIRLRILSLIGQPDESITAGGK